MKASPALDVLHHQHGEGRVWPLLHGLLGGTKSRNREMRNKKLEIGKETETEIEMEMVVTLNFFDIHNNIDINTLE